MRQTARPASSTASRQASDLGAVLAQARFSADLTPLQRSRLGALAMPRMLRKGQLLFHEGEACGGMYLVAEGLVKIVKLAPDGRERVLNVFPRGETFAEAALFGDARYPVTAQALAASRVLFFPREGLLALLRAEPEIGLRLMASLSRHLKFLTRQVEEMAFRSAAARLAFHLLDHAGTSGTLQLAIAKKDLAAQLAMSPETLSRLLKGLVEQRVVSVRGRLIGILAPAVLRAVASGGSIPPAGVA